MNEMGCEDVCQMSECYILLQLLKSVPVGIFRYIDGFMRTEQPSDTRFIMAEQSGMERAM